MSMFSNSYC